MKLKDIYNIKNIEKINEIENIIKKDGLSIFGAGQYSSFCLKYLIDNNYKINYIIDSNKLKENSKINNIKVIHNENNIKENVVFVTSKRYTKEIITNNNHRYQFLIPFDNFYIIKNYEKLLEIRNLLYDNHSIYIFDEILVSRFTGDIGNLENIYERNHYFCIKEFINTNFKETFLDIGAYVGDTVEKFIYNFNGNFNKIYAFEPGKQQFNALKKRVNRLKEEWALDNNSIITENLGVSNRCGVVYFNDNIDMSANYISNIPTNNKIETIDIDNYINNRIATFIKADIEGEELNMLKGAENTIKQYKPKLAISIYHRPEDFIEIISFIKNLVPEYKLYLRHHSLDLNETVLYCCL